MRDRARIGVFVSSGLVPAERHETVSGHVRIALKTAELLSGAGHDVTVFTTGVGTLPVERNGLNVVALPTHSRDYWDLDASQAAKQFARMAAHLQRGGYRMFHTFGAGRVGYQAALLRAMGVVPRCVVSVTVPDDQRLQRRLARFALAQADAVIAMTATSAALLDGLGARHVCLARPGVTKDLRGGRRLFPGCTVLYWRYGSPFDGGDLTLAAFHVLAPRFPAVHFVFAVADWSPLLGEMQALAAQHANVHVLTAPYNGLGTRDLLASADICVLPFRQASLHPQLTLLECLHTSTPVVTTTVGSNAEVLGQGSAGILLDRPEAAAIVDAVAALLDDEPRRAALAQGAAVAARLWNWDDYRTALLELYRELLA